MWKQICAEYQLPASQLNYVIRYNVVNRVTRRLIRELIPQGFPLDRNYYWTFTPDDEWFYAFLECPNCVGPVYLL